MSDESSDLSDFVNPRPSGSRSRLRSDPQKKKRRIVMRIEFDDSDEDMTSATSWSSDGEGQPMCSNQQRGCSTKQRSSCKSVEAANTDNDSDQIRRNSSRRRQARRPNVLSFNDSSTDSSSSGSEITQRFNSRRGKIVKKVIVSEDERDVNVGSSPQKRDEVQANKDEGGFASDSSSNDLLEKCPICLLTFRQQEIGSPATCVHIFCASCIEAWSKNMQTCPIDRIEFDRIVVRESFANRNIVREINVDSVVACEQQQQDLFVPGLEEAVEDEEPTNCEICESQEREDVMLLCDSCNQGYHIYCLTPPLDAIPEGSWYCDNCFDSQDESDDGEGIEEDLSLLYEDIRDMGIPQSRLRVTEVHQPRILRTRQNERIRAAVLRHTRSVTTLVNAAATATTTRRVGRPRTEITTAATTSSRMRIAARKKSSTARKLTCRRRRRRRRARQRTYVVEYDLNNLDEKFALKTTKKVVRRRKRKSVKKGARPSSSTNQSGRRLTSSQRLAEQMGVKRERTFINPAHSAGTSALSLFGNPNELEYFSESDQGGGGYGSEIEIETGHGTAVQTSVRISTPGSLRSRKDLLLGRLQGNRPRAGALEINAPSASEQTDILSNILDLQDRWYNATRNLVSVYINSDGTLVLPTGSGDENNTTSENATTAANSRTPVNTAATEGNQNPTPNISPAEMTQAPMHSQRGGGNQAFNSGGGGRYSNNNFSNQNNHRSGGGGSGSGGGNQYRHSIGGSVGGLAGNFNMVGRGNFSFSNPDYNSNQNQNPNSSFSSLNNRDIDRFNQRNRQQQRDNNNSNNVNTNQRHSFPFNNNQQSQQQRPPDGDNQLFEGQTPSQQMQRQHSPQRMAPQQIPPQHMAPQQIPPQPRPPQQMLSQHMSPHQQMPPQQMPLQQLPPQQMPPQQLPPQQMPPQQIPPQQMPPQQMPPQQMPPHPDRQSFGGLPPPMVSHLPPPPILNESQLFSGLPPPVAQQQQQHQMPPQNEPQLFGALPPPLAFGTHIPPPIAQQPPPAHLQPPILPSMSIPPPMVGPIIRSVPPPPAPPAALASWNSSLFSYAQDDDDDDSNCPNFSVYSQESQEVAKAAENKDVAAEGEPSKEDDENEDLVQLDDDDDIPVQTGNNTSQNSELYEPENPTEEIENESDNENENANNLKDSKASDNTGTDITEKERVIYETEKNIDDNHYDPEQETDTIHSLNEVTVEDGGLEKNDQHDTGAENISEKEESEKDEADEDKVPDDEESEADFEEEKEEEEENEHTNHNGDDGSNEKEAEKVEMENSAAVPEEETSASVPVKKITAEKGEDESDDDDEANCAENTKKIDSDGHTPSPVRPSIVHKKLPDADVSSSNRKGVLELYDDSDWDELDIDRPRSTERMDAFILAQVVEEEAKSNRDRTNDSNKEKNRDEDRSYTPCLDEKNDLEDEHNASVGAIQGGGTPELPNSALTKTITSSEKNNADDESEEGLVDEGTEVNTAIRADGISDEDKLEGRKEKRRKEKRSKRESERAETFKKVSNKQKERNYRSDKAEKQKERKRSDISPRSRSVTRSRSKSRSISRSPSRSRTRSRSRSRSLSRSRSRSRSRSHSHPRSPRPRSNSRLRSPRGGGFQRNRKRRFSRSPLLLRSSRSRSNDKENFFYVHNNNNYNHNYNYNHGYGFYNGRFQRGGFNNRFQNNRFYYRFGHRARRREMPRYDVRNIIGNSRNFHMKDRYGRDTSRPPHRSSRSLSHTRRRRSFSASRSRSFSVSPRRMRRSSFSISPSAERYRRSPRRRSFSPQNRHQARLRHSPATMYRRKSQSPLISSPIRNVRSSRSHSPSPRKGRKEKRHMQAGSPKVVRRKSRSVTGSPRYTPHLSRSRSGTPRSQSPRVRQKNKKKKLKERKKKKAKKRVAASKSPEPVRRISRQCDPYDLDLLPPEPPSKRQRHHSPPTGANDAAASLPIDERTWSPSPSPPPAREYENNISWTPPIASPREEGEFIDMFPSAEQRHDVPKPTTSGKKEKRKREKKKKKGEKRRDGVTNRKEKRRVARRTETPEPAPSKEVFASGNNILVSVSFNKEVTTGAANQPTQQTTVVTMPPSREDVVSAIRRGSTERLVTAIGPRRKKDRNHKRKKIDTKPVAIIDLERSPFQVHQEPADIIVLTDSEGANDDDEHDERRSEHHISEPNANEVENHHRPRLESSSGGGGGHTGGSHHEHTPPLLGTIIEETSFDIQPQTGPKTPPEPPVIKFTLLNKQQSKTRNPVHDAEDELNDVDEEEEEERMDMEGERMEQHRDDMEVVQTNQKIGPNTPPESGPRSPDVYDPFDPTKSPSLSPRSPTPPPLLLDKTPNSGGEGGPDVAEKHSGDERSRPMGERNTQQQVSTASAAGTGVSKTSTAPTMNPVELVMALMNSKQQTNSSQDMAAKSIESHYSAASSHVMTGVGNSAGQEESHAGSTIQNSSDDNNIASGIATSGITVLSNLLLSAAKPQHIPTISSPTPPMPIKSSHNMISKLPLPKVSKVVSGSSGSGGSGIGLSNSLRNGSGGLLDDSFDPDSPYSPASADYEDLFEPPPDNLTNSKYHSKRGTGSSKFDNLFGSSSPVGHLRLPSYTPSAKKYIPLPMTSGSRKLKVAKVGKSGDETIKVYDDVPNSAVELQVKDKFLRKLNRQERVVEEVKLILKPRFNKKQITKEDYKEIMRRAVPKICHSRSGEINPSKIKNLIDAYVKKFRAKHKKLNIINTGQVSSAVKCAAYLKKL